MSQQTTAPFLLAGLGNYGREYLRNRHNVGFMLVDELARRHSVTFSRQQSKALITDFHLDGHHVYMIKPQTYMNRSGQAVSSILNFYKISLDHLIVAYDDLDLPVGTIRIRPHGGTAGHRGMESIKSHLQSQAFPRLRIGIGRPPGRMDPAAYVLQDFKELDLEIIEITLSRAADCAERIILEGIAEAMNQCNAADETE
ncbi:MAG: aminoacyl-tRNA hydrolase [Anaerolineales bacterium]